MRRACLILAVLPALLAGAATAQPAPELRGQVFHLGEHGEKVPEARITVILQESGARGFTNDRGYFRLSLLLSSGDKFEPGEKITLDSNKQGWRIRHPQNGEDRVPKRLDREIINIELLPAGSPLFLAPDQLQKLIQELAQKQKQAEVREARVPGTGPAGPPRQRPATRTNRQSSFSPLLPRLRPGEKIASAGLLSVRGLATAVQGDAGRARSGREAGLPAPVFDPYIQEWAERYGFTAGEVKAAIGRWIKDVESHRKDAHQLGLAAFAKGQFAGAARLFRRSARGLPRQPAGREDLVRDLRLEGDSFRNNGDLAKALASYREAHRHTSRDETPELWAATLQDVALAQGSLGYTGSPTASAAEFADAVHAYRQTLDVYTREKRPWEWARTQNNLGVALRELALRADGERAHALLAEAEEAYRQALRVYTRDQFPQEWAATQNNLAIVLRAQAAQTPDERGAELLAEAIAANRQALLIRTREKLPEAWARTQNNLGVALQNQAARTAGAPGAQLLAEAVEAFRQALLVRTRERFPEQWATTQNNIGNALQDQARRVDGEPAARLLTEAVDAYRQALQVRTRERFPQEWAMIQNNLGNALRDQGRSTDGAPGDRLLAEAVEAFRKALLVRTREQFPQQWATTQNNLGDALVAQAVRADSRRKERLFGEARRAYRGALEVASYEHSPGTWEIARKGEAEVLMLTGGQREAAAVLSDILDKNPDDPTVFSSLALLLNNGLFEPDRALAILRPWLARHPADLAARLLEVEALFASGAFAECRTQAAALSETDGLAAQNRAVLLGYQLAAGLTVGAPEAPADLALLIEAIARESASFNTGRSFQGALHAVRERSGLPHRDRLVRLFQALEAPDRDSMLQPLREALAGR